VNETTSTSAVPDLDSLVPAWLSLPEVGERLRLPVNRVRQVVAEHKLVAVRRGENNALYVPADFVSIDGELLKGLGGLLNVLYDNKFTDVEIIRWLYTPDDSLPGSPAQALLDDRRAEVTRRAQALAF
jgi:Rv2175c C-terminal domain of unknown function